MTLPATHRSVIGPGQHGFGRVPHGLAINLRQMNLIGVYGTPANRRALVCLSNGRYKKVKVGDSIDGGRIVAIGDSELRYQKGGRNLTLKIPSG